MIDIRTEHSKIILRVEKDMPKGFVTIETELTIEQAHHIADLLHFSAELATNG